MEHLHEKLCWMLENNLGSSLGYSHESKEYTIYLVGHFQLSQFKGVIPEDCTIDFDELQYSIHDKRNNEVVCKVSGIDKRFIKKDVTEGLTGETVEELPRKLCGILEHNQHTTLRFEPASQRYIMFFVRNGKMRYLPKGYVIDFPNRRIIHKETGKILCGYQQKP